MHNPRQKQSWGQHVDADGGVVKSPVKLHKCPLLLDDEVLPVARLARLSVAFTFFITVLSLAFYWFDGMAELLDLTVRQSVGRTPESSEALACTLDDLLVRYLYLLDQYQKLRQDLNKLLSNVRRLPTIQPLLSPDLWTRVTYRLPKPIFPIPTASAMGKTITMIECKPQLLCTII